MKKPPSIQTMIRHMRERKAPSIDGSYVLLCKVRSPEYERAAHPAYTPAQIEAERKALGRQIANVVYFIRDEQIAAPYWVSPYRQAIRQITVKKSDSDEVIVLRIPHAVFTVARSRDSRKSESVEVAIPSAVLGSFKNSEERAKYVLEQLRKAIAAILEPVEAAA